MKRNTRWTKGICLILTTACLCMGPISASAEVENTDPYAEYHKMVDDMVSAIVENYENQSNRLETQINEIKEECSIMLQENNAARSANLSVLEQADALLYQEKLLEIEALETDQEELEEEKQDAIWNQLAGLGFVNGATDGEKFITETGEQIPLQPQLQALEAGQMQTSSSVMYQPQYKEFYYYVEYRGDLADWWKDYDLVSVQHKDDNGWYWNAVTVKGYEVTTNGTNTLLETIHCATKYSITEGSRISAREDFWNGTIFNVNDRTSQNMGTNYLSYLNKVTVQGWLHVNGEIRSTMVKSDFEHNYQTLLVRGGNITSSILDPVSFAMSVSYETETLRWLRTAGSRYITIPAGC